MSTDLLIGFLLSRFLGKPEAKSPAVVFPTSPGPVRTVPATAAPAAPAAVVPAPAFPQAVSVPPEPAAPSAAPAGFKKAVEVWQIKPSLAQQASSVIVGMGPEVGALTVQMLEAQFPNGWQGAKSATASEAATAKSLLAKWRDGGVVFGGPNTLTGRRAFRMTKHPAGATAAAPAPVARPTAPAGPTVPASIPATPAPAAAPAPRPAAPAAAPSPVTTLPEVLITADAPPAAAPAPVTAVPSRQVTTVRKGEGLANVAKRLGRPATAASANELRAANLPQGPDHPWQSQDLSKGGLKKPNRAGGLQPGDRLFVPDAWSPVDAARL